MNTTAVDKSGRVAFVQAVPEVANEPNDEVFEAVKKLG